MNKPLRVILAGATGWAGAALARGIARTDDLELVAAVARRDAGKVLGGVVGESRLTTPIHATASAALAVPCEVFVEFTRPDGAKANIVAALEAGAHVVVGTSGLSDEDYAEIDRLARACGRGVLACGNFALTVVLLQRFAEIAARYLGHFEVVDYAHEDKPDAPSGTARELAFRLGQVRAPNPGVPLDQVRGPVGARGATLNGVQVHSVRLPGYVIGVEAVFGAPGQRLHLAHHAGSSAEPYVDGALLAIRSVADLRGVHRGLDTVMRW
jgi:4-hydroxy-tetrahydrodipicolinate reductase